MKRICIRLTPLLCASMLGITGELLLPALFPSTSVSVYAFSLSQAQTSSPSPALSPEAILGFVGAIVAAIIGGLFGIYQTHRVNKLEYEKRKSEQEKQEMQQRLDNALRQEQFEDEIEKIRYEDWLVARREAQEQERERKKSMRNAARSVMVQAQTTAEREEAYRKAIHADPNIAQLQILDMAHPLDVTKVYVRLSLYKGAKRELEVDPALLKAESQRDPNALLRARLAFTNTRVEQAMTPEEALKKYPRCVVLGDPGAGKSTLLKYLTLQAVNRHLPHLPDIPIHIALGDFATSPNQDLLGFVAKRWDEWYGFPEDEARAYIENHLSDGSAILLLDALDETVIGGSDEAARVSYSHVLAAIDMVATRYNKAPVVVTVRKAGYYQRAHLAGFTELEVLDFRPAEIKQFIENWFQYHPARPKYATASDLNAQLAQNARVQALAANPLLLCLIVLVYESRQDLPEQRSRIYEQCVETLLFRWDTSRDIRRRKKFDVEKKQQLLEEMAWEFHKQGRRYFPEEELLEIIARFLPTVGLLPRESRAILSEIEEENGLLKEQAHGWHGFLHLTLQEYFIARYLIHRRDGQSILLKHCGEPWWEEVMMLYAGSIHDASPLLRALLRRERRNLLPWKSHKPLLWAGQCLAAKPRIVQRRIRDKIVARLFRLLKKASETGEVAVKALIGIEGNDARGKVLFVLSNKGDMSEVRRLVALTLGKLGDQSVVGELLAVLKDKQDEDGVRAYAAQALGGLGDQSMVGELLAVLKDKQDRDWVREFAAEALGELGDQSVVGELLAVLKDKQDQGRVRQGAALVLGRLGDQSVVGELLAVLKDKQDEDVVRRGAAQALGGLGDQSVVGELLAVLKDKQDQDRVRAYAAQALGKLGDQSVVGELLAVLKDKQDQDWVRRGAAQALGGLGDLSVVGELLTVRKKWYNNRKTREIAKIALVALGHSKKE